MNMHTDPGWWLVWLLWGSLIAIVIEAVVDRVRRSRARARARARGRSRPPGPIPPWRCDHKRLRFHSVAKDRLLGKYTKFAVCLDCGETNYKVELRSIAEGATDAVFSDVMVAHGYDQDPIDTTRWSKT